MSSFIRNVALHLAFLQMFSTAIHNFDTKDIDLSYTLDTNITQNIKYESSNENNITISKESIDSFLAFDGAPSIFDDDNIDSKQYGASQTVFRDNVEVLIEDPLIWDELQKVYPVSDFFNEEEARIFYQFYLYLVFDSGCGYAAAADLVYHAYENDPEGFQNTFGFPMYKINKNNSVDYNYEILMLKFFNFKNLVVDKSYDEVDRAILRKFYQTLIEKYSKESKYIQVEGREFLNWTEEEWTKERRKVAEKKKRLEELEKKRDNISYKKGNFGIEVIYYYNYLSKFLKQYGISISKTTAKGGIKNVKPDEILASKDLILYHLNDSGTVENKMDYDNHYVYVTEILEDGTIIVSSWGDKYIYEPPKNSRVTRIILKVKKK